MMTNKKVILLDSSVFVHRSIFSWASMVRLKNEGKLPQNALINPVGYTYFNMVVSTLTKIGVNKDDILIMAQDGRDSWRKDVYAPYKANRKEYRESHVEINWEEKYGEINKTVEKLKEANIFYWIQIPKIEADDVMAVAASYFKDKEVIIVSIDRDLEQLAHYENVKIYSLMSNYKGTKGSYKIIKNPLKIIIDKAKKGDISDNILVDKNNDTEHDYSLREYIINLIKLPEFVTKAVQPYLEDLHPKEVNYDNIPYKNSIAKRFPNIYGKDKIITYEDVVLYQERKEKRLTNKKIKLKKEAKEKKVSFR